MKFTVAGNKVICSRIDRTVEDKNTYRDVVEFDAHLDRVPPHVGAKLTRGEIDELAHFLADRKRIQADSAKINLVEALPELIDEVTDILNSVVCLNHTMYQRLIASVAQLADALDNVRPKRKRKVTPISGMRNSEVLKERLENIKRDL